MYLLLLAAGPISAQAKKTSLCLVVGNVVPPCDFNINHHPE
jgi:hypothetical protein